MRPFLLIAAILPAMLPGGAALPDSETQASEFNRGGASPLMNFQRTTKDAAVTSIAQVGPPFVKEGSNLTINVGIANNGVEEETFILNLRDDTEDKAIASQRETLAAGKTASISLTWNTEGATGGPPPPGPPTPGTVHVLTATVDLPGDTVSDNDSMSLLPGIWVIETSKPSGITFPGSSQEPAARTTLRTSSNQPSLETVKEPLVSTYVATESGQQDGALSNPPVFAAPASLYDIFLSPTGTREGLSIHKPEINTVAKPLPKIRSDIIGARHDRPLDIPEITTAQIAATEVFLYQAGLSAAHRFSGPAVSTAGDDLANIFAAPVESSENKGLTRPDIGLERAEPELIIANGSQANLSNPLVKPKMETRRGELARIFNMLAEVDAGRTLALTGFQTPAVALKGIFQGGVQASMFQRGTRPDFDKRSPPESPPSPGELGGIEGPETPPQDLADKGTLIGRIKLQGRTASLGSYVEVGGRTIFADRQGYFLVRLPGGKFDLTASAPGYLSISIHNITMERGEEIVVPTVTLHFGDADGNGLIDIYDFAVAARNYGTIASGIPFR